MTNTNFWFYAAIGAAAFLVGLSKGGLGGTVGVLVTPLLALALPADAALGVSLPLLMIGDVFAVWMYWRCWDTKLIWRLMPGVIVGLIIGSILLFVLPVSAIKTGIAVLVLVYCAIKLLEPALRLNFENTAERRWYAPVFGVGTGFASTLANAGGMVVNMYFLMQKFSPIAFMGTSALFYAILNAMKIPAFLLKGILQPAVFLQIAWAIPLIPLGVWGSKRLIERWERETFERFLLVLLAGTAVFLLIYR